MEDQTMTDMTTELAKLKTQREEIKLKLKRQGFLSKGETSPAVMRVVEWCFLNFGSYQMPEPVEQRPERVVKDDNPKYVWVPDDALSFMKELRKVLRTFDPYYRLPFLNQAILGIAAYDGELEVAYDPKAFLRFSITYDFLSDHQLGGSEGEPSAVASALAIHSRRMKRLCTIHNNIAERVPSPFSEEKLARLRIVPETDEDLQEGKRHREWCREMDEMHCRKAS
jgi:hypothetical protein